MILITGANGGLGSFLAKKFPNSIKLTRENNVSTILKSGVNFDLIIHCAASISHAGWDTVNYQYFDDNILLTREVMNIPHKKFVHISSIDVKRDSIYGISKRISERIVLSLSKDSLVIRPTGLIGNEMKTNTFKKIHLGMPIALTSNSLMNYVTYDDIFNLINSNVNGVITLSASSNISMMEVAEVLSQNIEYGDIHYDIDINEEDLKLRNGYDLIKTSEDNILNYIAKYHE